MNKIEKRIIDLLREFGLPANACKAYITLLKNYPATGYEISTQAEIPRSAIYSVLHRLETMGMVNSIGDSPKRYIPISPPSLVEHLDHLHSDRVHNLEDALEQLDVEEEAFDFWHLHGYHNLMLKCREAIVNASEKIFLSAWRKEIVSLDKGLLLAEEQGAEITMFSFCKVPRKFGTTVSYGIDESELLKIWNPKIILVVDQNDTIMGSTIDKSESRAIWTQNKAITEIATNHIILDITLAGQRLNFDPNPIVQRLMRRPDLNLDRLLK